MKRSGLLFAVFMLTAAVVFSGCGSSGGGGDNNNSGKIAVALTEAADFNGKKVVCAVFDSDATDETGMPTGDPLGMGYIDEVTDGSGSCVILDEDENEEVFAPGVYYLMALADLNDNFDEMGEPDAGDKVMPFTAITVNGNVTKNITGAAFTMTVGSSLETPGKITVELFQAAEFNGKLVICAVFDSDATDETGMPVSEPIGMGYINEVTDGSGSCVIEDMLGNEKIFAPGVYYLMALADLNDNFNEMGEPDAGDKVMPFKAITVNTNVTVHISGGVFTMTVEEESLGTITVALSEAADFNGKSVFCYIFDNDATVPEEIFNDSTLTSISPRDNPIGIGVIDEVINGSGSCVIMEAEDETFVKAFTPGVYYLMALADLNDNFAELGKPDTGDKILSFAWIEADGDTTRDISGISFYSVLGENCIANGGFEEVRDWTFYGEGDYDYEPGNAYTGVRSVCLAPGSYIEQTYEGPVTEIYEALVIYVYARGSVGDSIMISKEYYDSAGEWCGGGGGPNSIYTTDYQKCLSIDEWIDGSEKKIKLRITADAENQDDIWIDDVYMGGRL